MKINRISIDLDEIKITFEKLYGQEFMLDISLSKEQEDEHEGGSV